MSSSIEQFKHESLEDSESIGKYLEALRQGFEKGALLFSSDKRDLMAKPRGLINLEVEARRKGDDIKLTLKFRWTESSGSDQGKQKPLRIQPMENT